MRLFGAIGRVTGVLFPAIWSFVDRRKMERTKSSNVEHMLLSRYMRNPQSIVVKMKVKFPVVVD